MQQMECIQSVETDFSKCVKPCSGMVIASFTKSGKINLQDLMSKALSDYNNLINCKGFPHELKGTNNCDPKSIMCIISINQCPYH